MYQWLFASTIIQGKTNSSLNLLNIQIINAGDYDAVLTDNSGSITSRVAHLEVDPTFNKITIGDIVNDGENSSACAWGDYDRDGFLDLFVTKAESDDFTESKNFLYHKNRDGTFTRVTSGSLANDLQSRRCGAWADYDKDGAWGDYDNDGRPDLFVANAGNPKKMHFTTTTPTEHLQRWRANRRQYRDR
jgi:hypothetical protein